MTSVLVSWIWQFKGIGSISVFPCRGASKSPNVCKSLSSNMAQLITAIGRKRQKRSPLRETGKIQVQAHVAGIVNRAAPAFGDARSSNRGDIFRYSGVGVRFEMQPRVLIMRRFLQESTWTISLANSTPTWASKAFLRPRKEIAPLAISLLWERCVLCTAFYAFEDAGCKICSSCSV